MEMNIRKLQDNFRQYRINYPLTQKELAEKAGISLRSIIRFENGEDITLSNFLKLMDALDLTANMMNAIPEQTNRPSAYLKGEKRRQRAISNRNDAVAEKAFKWGDEG